MSSGMVAVTTCVERQNGHSPLASAAGRMKVAPQPLHFTVRSVGHSHRRALAVGSTAKKSCSLTVSSFVFVVYSVRAAPQWLQFNASCPAEKERRPPHLGHTKRRTSAAKRELCGDTGLIGS